jgi:hypothetical protein
MGKRLAWLLLDREIRGIPSVLGASKVAYWILVDADNNLTTGKIGIDY